MSNLRHRNNDFFFLIPYLVSLGSNLLIYRQGYRLTPDSVYYVSVANNLADHGSLFGFDSNFLDQYPPLYSILLYPGMFLSLNAWVFLLHVAAGFSLISLFMHICRLLGIAKFFSITLVVIYSLSVSYLEICGMVWSESIFNALLLLVVFLVIRILSREQFIHQDLIWLLISTWLLLGTRYIGLVVIPLIFLFLVIKFRKWFSISLYSLALSVPLLGYYIHYSNHELGLFGTRYSSTASVSDSLLMLPRAMGSHFIPNDLDFLSVLFGVFVLVFFILSISLSKLDFKQYFLLSIVVLYILALIYSEIRTQVDPINTRFLSPISPIGFILVGTMYFQKFASHIRHRINLVVLGVLSILLVANGTHLLYNFAKPSISSIGLINELNMTIKSEPAQISDTPIFSTNPWRTFLETGLQPVNLFPTTVNYYNPPDKIARDVSRLESTLLKRKWTLFYCYAEISSCENYLKVQNLDWKTRNSWELGGSLSNLFVIYSAPLLQE